MTLPEVVLFPQATMPLYIFEPRYRKMLADSLGTHSLFGIATRDRAAEGDSDFESFHPVGTLGIIRSSQMNDDGTSSILVQGLTRMRIREVIVDSPYRKVAIDPILPLPDAMTLQYTDRMTALTDLIRQRTELGERISEEMMRFLTRIEDPEVFADIVAYALLEDTACKLDVLAAETIPDRYTILLRAFKAMNADLEMRRKLQGRLDDERIDLN